MKDGFLRVCTATPRIKTADCQYNIAAMEDLAKKAAAEGASVMIFPELSVTGYTCGDLFLQRSLQKKSEEALLHFMQATAELDCVFALGLPLVKGASLYNCAAVVCHGKLLGVVPKTYIPNYGEFSEQRWFSAGSASEMITVGGEQAPFGNDLLFACEENPDFVLGIELGEDLWVSCPPSSRLTAQGATIIGNLSASAEVIGKAEYRRTLVMSQSARTLCAYLYANAGEGESTTDLVFAGQNLIAENGALLAESKRFSTGNSYADIDLQRLTAERRRISICQNSAEPSRTVFFRLPQKELELRRFVAPMPFVPVGEEQIARRCEEIFAMQSAGLQKRLQHTHCKTAVIGLSGGLDSTLALLVTVHAFDSLRLDRKGIVAISMPCFGTTSRTKGNAQILAELLDTTFYEIPIAEAVTVHLKDIGQDPEKLDVTFENAQARERTQVLMDMANKVGGMVIGTGDLSELALGWATYNGDHMSMYGVNCSVPKTLVRHLVKYRAGISEGALSDVLLDILDTPVSPELLPPKDGEISQKTESIVGPYELHDFFLYYILRFGFTPAKIYRLALHAFCGKYPEEEIFQWLKNFYRRFFSQQFKRSCLPDGPKLGTVGLSPRGDWKMPSDASAALWLEEVEGLERKK